LKSYYKDWIKSTRQPLQKYSNLKRSPKYRSSCFEQKIHVEIVLNCSKKTNGGTIHFSEDGENIFFWHEKEPVSSGITRDQGFFYV